MHNAFCVGFLKKKIRGKDDSSTSIRKYVLFGGKVDSVAESVYGKGCIMSTDSFYELAVEMDVLGVEFSDKENCEEGCCDDFVFLDGEMGRYGFVELVSKKKK